ncbi:MAG: sigma-54-dependent transcriptional regulator [Planctomycetota bacterium]
MRPRILVVDDDKFMRTSLVDALKEGGYEGEAHAAAAPALEALQNQQFDLAITDLKMPTMGGIEFLERAREHDSRLPVIVITAHGTVQTAVEAMKKGASDYLLKPFGVAELRIIVERVLQHRRLVGENEALRGEQRRHLEHRPLLGDSPALAHVRQRIAAIADSNATVLIRGETGTGKELVARAIHYSSRRAERPFLCVNCAALSAGLLESELFGHEKGAFTGADRQRIGRFELADGGTLLLDEVSEIDLGLQSKLLRVLQESSFERVGSGKTQRVDVHVLATTNRRLEDEVRCGRFREDLYYRLNVLPIELPPLRERKDDILALADVFRTRAEKRAGKSPRPFSELARKLLLAYHWPGNVRELENLVERAVLLSPGGNIEIDGMQHVAIQEQRVDAAVFRGMALEQIEKVMIEDTLRQYGGHQKKTAASLGIGVRTLRDKIKKWDLYTVGRELVNN